MQQFLLFPKDLCLNIDFNSHIYEFCQKSYRTGCTVWAIGERGVNGLRYIFNKISWEYLTVIRFLQPLYFFHMLFVCIYFSCCAAMSTEERTMNTEQRINLMFFGLGKLRHEHLKCFSQSMEITPSFDHVFLSGTRNSKLVMGK